MCTYNGNDDESTKYVIKRMSLGGKDDEANAFHASLETFASFFIDGASNIDAGDPRWEVLVVWEQHRRLQGREDQDTSTDDDDVESVALVGYLTLFTFTNPTRRVSPSSLRVCQALVFPPFQRQGHGRRLMDVVHTLAKDRDCFEVTVEDPAPGFVRLRSSMDMRRCMTSELFAKRDGSFSATSKKRSMDERNRTCSCSDYAWIDACKPLSQTMIRDAQRKLRTTCDQIVRCYESLILARLDRRLSRPNVRHDAIASTENPNDADSDTYKPFRLMVKRRLYSSTIAATPEKRKRALHKRYHELVDQYRATWNGSALRKWADAQHDARSSKKATERPLCVS